MGRRKRGESTSSNRRSRRPRGGGCLLLIVFATLLGAGAWFAPQLYVRSPGFERVVSEFAADLQLQVDFERVSVSWLSPVVIQTVKVTEQDGGPLAQIHAVRTSKRLWQLLRDSRDLGRLTIEKPVVDVTIDTEGNNVQRLVSRYRDLPSSGPRRAVSIHVEEGTIRLTDRARGEAWIAENVTATVDVPVDSKQPVSTSVAAHVPHPAANPATIEAALRWHATQGDAQLVASEFPLQLLNVVFQSIDPHVHLAGLASGRIQASWDASTRSVEVESFSVRDFLLEHIGWLRSDRLVSRRVTLTGRGRLTSEIWDVAECRLQSDFGDIAVDGSGPVRNDLRDRSLQERLLSMVLAGRAEARGVLELAPLARSLPETLRLRETMRVDAGQLSLELQSNQQRGEQLLLADFQLSNLAGREANRIVKLSEPIEARLAARYRNGNWRIEEFRGQAPSLQLDASGSASQGELTFIADLQPLLRDLSDFVNLQQVQVVGRLAGKAHWQSAPGGLRLLADAEATNFQWRKPTGEVWTEKKLVLALDATGAGKLPQLHRLHQLKLGVESGLDRCEVVLLDAVSPVSRNSTWPVTIDLEGDMKSWRTRLQGFGLATLPKASGRVAFSGDVVAAPDQVEIRQLSATLGQCVFPWGDWLIEEPAIEIETTGIWQFARRRWASPVTKLTSSSFAFRLEDFNVDLHRGLQIDGLAGYRADLARVSKWQRTPTRQLAGELVGQLKFLSDGQTTSIETTGRVNRFEYQQRPRSEGNLVTVSATRPVATLWSEPQLAAAVRASWNPTADDLKLQQIDIAGEHFKIVAAGAVRDVRSQAYADLQGEIEYDLAPLLQTIQVLVSSPIRLQGRHQEPFSFRGPLRSTSAVPITLAAADAQAQLTWDSASLYGFVVGPGSTSVDLREGLLQLQLVDLAVSQGLVSVTPEVDLKSTPLAWSHPPGTVAEAVRITPGMCQGWLKFVAPLLASATSVDGTFSLELSHAEAPVADLFGGNIQGVLNVHRAQVGPGPLSQQFLWLADQIKAVIERRNRQGNGLNSSRWVTMPEQRLAFRVHDNRVEHRGLQFIVDDVVIRTSGSVDKQQRLQIVAEVPIQEEWIGDDRWLASLRGQTLQIPMRGTLSDPQLDLRVLDQIARQMVTGAAENLLEQEINRGLQRLLGQ